MKRYDKDFIFNFIFITCWWYDNDRENKGQIQGQEIEVNLVNFVSYKNKMVHSVLPEQHWRDRNVYAKYSHKRKQRK